MSVYIYLFIIIYTYIKYVWLVNELFVGKNFWMSRSSFVGS